MKTSFRVALLFMGLLTTARCDPADLEAAIRALLAQPNFSWRATFERTEGGQRSAYDGKCERDGYTVVTTDLRNLAPWVHADIQERPLTIVYIDEASVANPGEAWLTPRELVAFFTSRPSGMIEAANAAMKNAKALGSLPGARTTSWANEGRINTPLPNLILAHILAELENAKAGGRAITADVTERAALALFDTKLAVPGVDGGSMGISVRAPGIRTTTSAKGGRTFPSREVPPAPAAPRMNIPRLVSYRDGHGTGTFWIVDGMLAKFELRLDALESLSGRSGENPHHVVVTATMNDVGTTTVDVPRGAREKLGR